MEDIEDNESDSGPFCIHWADPSDCDELCQCGHKCFQHNDRCYACDCLEFREIPK